MKLLLDSHTVLWWMDQHQRISDAARHAISDAANDLYLSAATPWELAIKLSLGKLQLSMTFGSWMEQAIHSLRAELIPIELPHLEYLSTLPFHHRDPFDRLMVAQASVEGLAIVSCDEHLDGYDLRRVW